MDEEVQDLEVVHRSKVETLWPVQTGELWID